MVHKQKLTANFEISIEKSQMQILGNNLITTSVISSFISFYIIVNEAGAIDEMWG